jgi:hypothetical protein
MEWKHRSDSRDRRWRRRTAPSYPPNSTRVHLAPQSDSLTVWSSSSAMAVTPPLGSMNREFHSPANLGFRSHGAAFALARRNRVLYSGRGSDARARPSLSHVRPVDAAACARASRRRAVVRPAELEKCEPLRIGRGGRSGARAGRGRGEGGRPGVEVELLPDDVQRERLDAFERIGQDVSETVERRPASLVVVQVFCIGAPARQS